MIDSIVILGSGHVAHHFTLAFIKANINVIQVYNRSRKGLVRISSLTKIPFTTQIKNLEKADLYLIAVSDDGIDEITKGIVKYIPSESIVAHTSGNCSIEVFRSSILNFGAFYPLQSIRKDKSLDFKKIPILITASNNQTSKSLMDLANRISDHVKYIEDEKRAKLHLPAVMVNNFVNHMYTLAFEFCNQEHLDIDLLFPLMNETLEAVKKGVTPQNLQTGPAVRNDLITIKRHRSVLKKYPHQLRLYNYITKHIHEFYEDR